MDQKASFVESMKRAISTNMLDNRLEKKNQKYVDKWKKSADKVGFSTLTTNSTVTQLQISWEWDGEGGGRGTQLYHNPNFTRTEWKKGKTATSLFCRGEGSVFLLGYRLDACPQHHVILQKGKHQPRLYK